MCNFTKQNVLRYNSCNNSVLQNPYRHLDGKTKKIYFPQFYGFSLFIGLYLFLLFACAAVLHLCIVHVLYAIMQKQVCKLHTKILCFFPILLLILVLLVLSKFSGFILVLMVLSQFSWSYSSSPGLILVLLILSWFSDLILALLFLSLFSWSYPSSPGLILVLLILSQFFWSYPSSPDLILVLLS